MRKYNSYKESQFEWLGDIPSHWIITKNRYGFLKSNNGKNETDETTVLSLTTKGVRVKKDLSFGKSTESYIGHQLVKEGDIVFTPRDFDQTPILSDVSKYYGCISNLYIVDKTKDGVLNYFVNYYWYGLKYSVDYFKNFSHGMRYSFNRFQFDEIPLLIPPLTEQQEIVSYLDTKTSQIDTLIEKTQRKIELLKEKRTSLINELVTKGLNPNVKMKESGVKWIGEIPSHWVVSKLKLYIVGIKDGTHGTHQNDDDGEILLSGKNVLNDKLIITENERRISKSEHEKIISNGFPKKGDVLVVSIGHTLGKVCTYDLDYPISFQRSVCFIRPKDSIISRWLYYNIRSDYFQSQIKVKLNMSTIGGIYMGDLSDCYIPILPKKEQTEIVSYLDEHTQLIDTTISIEERRIELLKEYRQSLISEVVTGKRKVTND